MTTTVKADFEGGLLRLIAPEILVEIEAEAIVGD